jgi:uncharacterized membrane protein SirB2
MSSTAWLVVSLVITIAFILLGRIVAEKKNRSAIRWGVAVAIFPPVVLILLFLPTLSASPKKT